jgi:hypothetical protein
MVLGESMCAIRSGEDQIIGRECMCKPIITLNLIIHMNFWTNVFSSIMLCTHTSQFSCSVVLVQGHLESHCFGIGKKCASHQSSHSRCERIC